MHVRSLLALVIVLSSSLLLSQTDPAMAHSAVGAADLAKTRPEVLIAGRVRVQDGSPPPHATIIQCSCGGAPRNVGYTDPSGNFTVQLGNRNPGGLADITNPSLDGEPSLTSANMNQCELTAVLSGFSSSRLILSSVDTGVGEVNVGTIILAPSSTAHEFTISAADYAAPDKARKEFDAGRKEEKKGKWASAREKLLRALSIYSRFPLAWVELGRVQIKENDIESARTSFRNALNVDSRLVTPYAELAVIEAQAKNWPAVAENTSHVLELDPVSLPQFWFLNAVANYNAGKFDSAEKSALRGITLDSSHRMPEMEYILGLVLGAKKHYEQAAMHIRSFLQLAPMHHDALQARDQLNQLQQLSMKGGGTWGSTGRSPVSAGHDEPRE
jgi:tetratricopeptide (TPR) repeat protein